MQAEGNSGQNVLATAEAGKSSLTRETVSVCAFCLFFHPVQPLVEEHRTAKKDGVRHLSACFPTKFELQQKSANRAFTTKTVCCLSREKRAPTTEASNATGQRLA